MEIKYFNDTFSINNFVADQIYNLAKKAFVESKTFSLVLSGGNTPLDLYKTLTNEPYKNLIPWNIIHFFFCDERMVDSKNSLSNYYNAQKCLFDKLPIPEKNIHRIFGESASPESASNLYEKHLKDFFKLKKNQFPIFDLILLGLGNDGHTASLFPNDKILNEKKHIVRPVMIAGLKPFVPRVTLTLPTINLATNVIFMVYKENKEQTLDAIFKPNNYEIKFPAQMVKPKGNLFWYIKI